jgi:hypothetical protein
MTSNQKEKIKKYSPYVAGGLLTTGYGLHKLSPALSRGAPVGLKSVAALARFSTLPYHAIKGQPLAAFGKKRIYALQLSPDNLWNEATEITRKKVKDFDSLPDAKKSELVSSNKLKATLKMLSDQEADARARGYTHLIGATHFPADFAAKMGYAQSDVLHPKVTNKLLAGDKSPFSYYKKEEVKALNKLKTEGLGNMSQTDIYFLTAPRKNVKLFEKDLTISHADAVAKATKSISTYTPQFFEAERLRERAFNSTYNDLLSKKYTTGKNG